ncbi:hypothetical protein M0657_011173 [Pyricularia oryzae]|nr:hypothetical protein M0657_011173 [Pyricularia oryzae]
MCLLISGTGKQPGEWRIWAHWSSIGLVAIVGGDPGPSSGPGNDGGKRAASYDLVSVRFGNLNEVWKRLRGGQGECDGLPLDDFTTLRHATRCLSQTPREKGTTKSNKTMPEAWRMHHLGLGHVESHVYTLERLQNPALTVNVTSGPGNFIFGSYLGRANTQLGFGAALAPWLPNYPLGDHLTIVHGKQPRSQQCQLVAGDRHFVGGTVLDSFGDIGYFKLANE